MAIIKNMKNEKIKTFFISFKYLPIFRIYLNIIYNFGKLYSVQKHKLQFLIPVNTENSVNLF